MNICDWCGKEISDAIQFNDNKFCSHVCTQKYQDYHSAYERDQRHYLTH